MTDLWSDALADLAVRRGKAPAGLLARKGGAARQPARDAVARAETAKKARRAATIARGGQVLEPSYRTPVGHIYDTIEDVGASGLEALGADPRYAHSRARGVPDLIEGLTGADSIVGGVGRVANGNADLGDYVGLGLDAAFSLPGIGLAGRAAKKLSHLLPEGNMLRRAARYAKGAEHYDLVDGKLVPKPLYDVDELPGGAKRVRRADTGAPRIVRNPHAEAAESLEELRGILADPEQNVPAPVADEYAREKLGHGYDTSIPAPQTSLEKQAGIGRVFNLAETGDPAYKQAIFDRYKETRPDLAEGLSGYDDLNEAAYRALNKEVRDQLDRLPVELNYHNGEGEYGAPSEMLRDVLGRGKLNVLSGGDYHPFLGDVDPDTGLTGNEMFRAVHDYFGHGTRGATFRPGGEELAYASHHQMLSPLAQVGLLAETRGQNSVVNYTPRNARVIGEMNTIQAQLANGVGDPATLKAKLRALGKEFNYASQEPVVLPPEYLDPATKGGIPDYVRPLIHPDPATVLQDTRGVHFSRNSGIEVLDPSRYGAGHRGAEYARTKGRSPDRTHLYLDPDDTLDGPEAALRSRYFDAHKYEGNLSGLYPSGDDPAGLVALANAYGPAKNSRDPLVEFENLVKDYGYSGYTGKVDEMPAAASYDPVPVRQLTPPELKTEKQLKLEQWEREHGLRAYAEGGLVDRSKWDKRVDGSDKSSGFLGVMQRPDGTVSSELSIGVDWGDGETEIPTMVPGLTPEELNYLLKTPPHEQLKTMPPSIRDKAVAHARARIAAGKSPFYNDGEQ